MARAWKAMAAIMIGLPVLCRPAIAAAATVVRTAEHGRTVITIAGPAQLGDAKRFAEVVAASPVDPKTIVDLSGPGGVVLDGLRIGAIIYRAGWTTRVGDGHACFSTCAFIWLAGRRRVMSSDAHIALHAIYDERLNKVTDVGRRMVAVYAKDVALNDATVAFIMAKGPGEGFDWLDAKKAKAIGIDMDIVPSAKRQVGRFSTAAIDEVEGAAADERQGGAEALYSDIAKCYVHYKRTRDDTKGFQCFVLESVAVIMAAKRAKTENHRVDLRLTQHAAVGRLVSALYATGHTRGAARRVIKRWEADLHATAQR